MVEVDRFALLRLLDERHDDLMRQLDELNDQIELTLARCGATPSLALPLPDPGAMAASR